MTEAKIYGIDLGTTYSCIAHVNEYGQAEVIPNFDSQPTTPSVVYFNDQERVVGEQAKNVAVMYPTKVIEMAKRYMGTEYTFNVNDTEYRPEQISAFILKKLVQDAETMRGEPITDVVITCPAYFKDAERKATRIAGEIAGLTVRDIIDEPTAAAIAYGLKSGEDCVALIYDLGGGTFDVTMIEIKGNDFNMIVTGGNRLLGGRDWDALIVSYLAQCWQDQYGFDDDPMNDLETRQDLYGSTESAKKRLTNSKETRVVVRHQGQGQAVTLTREKFDELTAALLNQTIMLTKQLLTEAEEKGFRNIDKFLLVGGSTKMPQVAEAIEANFGIKPIFNDPDMAVARGAAFYGQILSVQQVARQVIEEETGQKSEAPITEISDKAMEKVQQILGISYTAEALDDMIKTGISTVISRSLGVIAIKEEAVGEREIVANLIQVQESIPTSRTMAFQTYADNQPVADIRVVENEIKREEADVSQSRELGLAVLKLPPHLPKGSPIEITFEFDKSGMLKVTAVELTGHQQIKTSIQTNNIMKEEEIEEAKGEFKHIVVK